VTDLGTELRTDLAAFAGRSRVLVAVDFDGTLAPFVLDPMQARALPGAVEALRSAAELDGVTVAVVSGRELSTLSALTGIDPGEDIALIGSHGAQVGGMETTHIAGQSNLDEDTRARLGVVKAELETIKAEHPAVRLEYKPTAVALHTRGVESATAATATMAAKEVAQRHPGVHLMPGKDVVELTVLEANKGTAVVQLARQTSSQATLYVGDDVTDERVFTVLDPAAGDLSVKVGQGDTAAVHRVSDPALVVELLELFVQRRRAGEPRHTADG
jgi:trehalose 6-phosphate phosphatase